MSTDNSAVAHKTSDAPSLTAEQQLERYKEKTAQWKAAVKAQLDDAASKNTLLRDELKKSKESNEAMLVQQRLELTTEFKERTEEKDVAIARLTEDVRRIKAQHVIELDALRQQCDKSKEEALQLISSEHEQIVAGMRRQAEGERERWQEERDRSHRQLEDVRHELAIANTKLSQLRSVTEELQKQIGAKAEGEEEKQAAHNVALEGEVAHLRQQLELITSKHQQQSLALSRSEEEHRAALQRRDEIREDDIQRREERIIVLQTILKQSQREANELQLQWAALQDEHHRVVDAHVAELSKRVQQLHTTTAALDDTKRRFEALEKEHTAVKTYLADVEEASAIRDKAFQDLFMSDEQKVMLVHLEHKIASLTDEVATWRERYQALSGSLEAERADVRQLRIKAQEEMEGAEAKLRQLEERQNWVHAHERRLHEQHQAVAAQAAKLLSATGIGSGALSAAAAASLPQREGSAAVSVSEPLASATTSNGDSFSSSGHKNVFMQTLFDSLHEVRVNYSRALQRANGSKRQAASLLFRHYRRALPVLVAILLFVTVAYWYLFSGVSPSSTSGEKSMSALSDMSEELKAMKREYGLLLGKLSQCCPQESMPPALPAAVIAPLK